MCLRTGIVFVIAVCYLAPCRLSGTESLDCSPDSLRRLIERNYLVLGGESRLTAEIGRQAQCLADAHVELAPVDSGFMALAKGNYGEALGIFGRLTDSRYIGLNRGYGYMYLAITHYVMAQKSLNTGNGDSVAHYCKLALSEADSSKTLGFSEASWWLLFGNSFYLNGKYEQALAYYDSALAMKPTLAGAWTSKASTYCAMARFDEGLECIDSALKYEHDNAIVWVVLSGLQAGKWGHDYAVTFLDSALKYQHDLHEAWDAKCMCLSIVRRYREGLTACDSALYYRTINLYGGNLSRAWGNRAICLWRLGRTLEAIANCDSALFYEPNAKRFLKLRATIMDSAAVKE